MSRKFIPCPAAIVHEGEVSVRPRRLTGEEPLTIRVDQREVATLWRIPGEDIALAKGFLAASGITAEVLEACYCSGAVAGVNPYNLLDLTLGAPREPLSPSWTPLEVSQLDDAWQQFSKAAGSAKAPYCAAGIDLERAVAAVGCVSMSNALDKAAGLRELTPAPIIALNAPVDHELMRRIVAHGAPKVVLSPAPPTAAAAQLAADHAVGIATSQSSVPAPWTVYGDTNAVIPNATG